MRFGKHLSLWSADIYFIEQHLSRRQADFALLSKAAEDCRYEAHNQYFDIQYAAEGQERMGYAKREGLKEDTACGAEGDLVFFKEPCEDGWIFLQAGDAAAVSPEDAHKPRCMEGTPCKVRKIVLKVRV